MSTLAPYNGLQIVTPDPTGDGGLALNDNFKALSTALETTDPSPSNDQAQHYSVGSRWVNTTTGVEWLCKSSATDAAVWVAIVPTLDQVTATSGTTVNSIQVGALAVTGTTSLDDGAITTDGNGTINALALSIASSDPNGYAKALFANDIGSNFAAEMCGSTFADSSLYNTAVLFTVGASSLVFATDGGINSGGTTPIEFRQGGYAATPQIKIDTDGTVKIDGGLIQTDGNGSLNVQQLTLGNTFMNIAQASTPSQMAIGDTTGFNNGTTIIIDSNSGYTFTNGSVTVDQNLSVDGNSTLDGGAITTDGSGTLTVSELVTNDALFYNGFAAYNPVSLDFGAINTDGVGSLTATELYLTSPTFNSNYEGLSVSEALNAVLNSIPTFTPVNSVATDYNLSSDGNGNLTAGSINLNGTGGSFIVTTENGRMIIGDLGDNDTQVQIDDDNNQIRFQASGGISFDRGLITSDGTGDMYGQTFYANTFFDVNGNGMQSYPTTGGNAIALGDPSGNHNTTQLIIDSDAAQFAFQNGATSLDGGTIYTDGSGDLFVQGTSQFDNGRFTTDGAGNLTAVSLYLGEYNFAVDSGGNMYCNDWSNGPGSAAIDAVSGAFNCDNGGVSTDGGGNVSLASITLVGTSGSFGIGMDGHTNLVCDGADIGSGITTINTTTSKLLLTPQSSAPSGSKGAIYCDTSGNAHIYNGTAWKQFTVS